MLILYKKEKLQTSLNSIEFFLKCRLLPKVDHHHNKIAACWVLLWINDLMNLNTFRYVFKVIIPVSFLYYASLISFVVWFFVMFRRCDSGVSPFHNMAPVLQFENFYLSVQNFFFISLYRTSLLVILSI